MIVDTSALLAVVLDEPDAGRFLEAILAAERPRMSLLNWLEAAMVIESKGGRLAGLRFDEVVRAAGIEVAPVTLEQAEAARVAWRYFGTGRHTARLNFGDCFAYALAKTEREALLFKGEDFSRTDVEAALGPLPGLGDTPATGRADARAPDGTGTAGSGTGAAGAEGARTVAEGRVAPLRRRAVLGD